jgi:hypothetical protein
MATIFELVVAQEITAFWDTLAQDREPFLGEELFPAQKKLGLNLKWIKGKDGLPVVLNPSAFDVKAIKRDRIGFEKLSAQMPFFKESMYIDEELRQELNIVLETGNQAYIDSVINRVYNDEIGMLQGAAAQRERMRMMALTTGAIAINANGQELTFDYGVEAEQLKTAQTVWSTVTAPIIDDIRTWQDEREDATGVRPTRAICSRKTWGYFLKNTEIRNGILGNNSAAPVSDAKVRQYLLSELDLEVVVYTKRYLNEAKVATKYVADDTFVLFPAGALGTGWFGTTPEESDLNAGTAANVSITDTGVAVTTMKETDPVTVDTKVTMIYLPSFEQADKIIIADVA